MQVEKNVKFWATLWTKNNGLAYHDQILKNTLIWRSWIASRHGFDWLIPLYIIQELNNSQYMNILVQY